MPNSRCFAPVRGRMMRVTRLDGCGRPVYGDGSVSASEGFVSVAFTGNNSETEAIEVTNANGRTCVNVPSVTNFQNYTLEIQFCEVDPAIFALLTGQEAIVDPATGDLIGFSVNSEVDTESLGFALEVWTGTPTGSGCTDDATQGQFGYLLVPFAQGGTFGDFTVENGAITFSVTGAQTKEGASWGSGPYDVQMVAGVPAPLQDPIKRADHLRVMLTEVAPPEDYCGSRPLLDPEAADVTSISATQDTTDPMEFEFSPTPTGTDPMWYDFGDGTWDYTEDGTITHTYQDSGTYTAYGYRGGSSATVEVVVDGS